MARVNILVNWNVPYDITTLTLCLGNPTGLLSHHSFTVLLCVFYINLKSSAVRENSREVVGDSGLAFWHCHRKTRILLFINTALLKENFLPFSGQNLCFSTLFHYVEIAEHYCIIIHKIWISFQRSRSLVFTSRVIFMVQCFRNLLLNVNVRCYNLDIIMLKIQDR